MWTTRPSGSERFRPAYSPLTKMTAELLRITPQCVQYPFSKEAEEGIAKVHRELVNCGTIIDYFPVNSSILPMKKADDSWRFIQDLRGMNDSVFPRAPIVPNPVIILFSILPQAKWSSVIDLANAFFSVPVHPDSQFSFAYTFKGKWYT